MSFEGLAIYTLLILLGGLALGFVIGILWCGTKEEDSQR